MCIRDSFYAEIKKDNPVKLTVSDDCDSVTVTGEIPETAINKPIDFTYLERQLSKLGGTIYQFGNLNADIDDGLSLSAKTINALRRNAVEALNLKSIKRNTPEYICVPLDIDPENKIESLKEIRVRISNQNQLDAVSEACLLYTSEFTYDSDGFDAEINLEKSKLVFFSVPYDKGWTAYVNGKPADIEKVSYGFMAVKADAGENTIEFRYETPGLKIGIVISIIGLICLGAYIVVFRKKKNNESGFSHCYDYSKDYSCSMEEQYLNKKSANCKTEE